MKVNRKCDMLKDGKRASITVETTFMMVLVLGAFVFLLYVSFYLYDRCIMTEAGYEAAVWECAESRITKITDQGEVEQVGGQLLQGRNFFFSKPAISAQTSKTEVSVAIVGNRGVWKDSIVCSCSITKPEELLRMITVSIDRRGKKNGDDLQTGSE